MSVTPLGIGSLMKLAAVDPIADAVIGRPLRAAIGRGVKDFFTEMAANPEIRALVARQNVADAYNPLNRRFLEGGATRADIAEANAWMRSQMTPAAKLHAARELISGLGYGRGSGRMGPYGRDVLRRAMGGEIIEGAL